MYAPFRNLSYLYKKPDMKYTLLTFFIFINLFIYAQENEKRFELINRSEHKAELIFDNQAPEGIMFRTELFRNWQIYKSENSLILRFPIKDKPTNEIHLFYDSVSVKKGIFSESFRDTLKAIQYRTNTLYIENDSGYMDVVYVHDTTDYFFENARIQVIQQGARCTDSGINSIKVNYKDHYIFFKYLNNIKLFEYDLNNDGKFEIYIINFSCCDSKLKIYRII